MAQTELQARRTSLWLRLGESNAEPMGEPFPHRFPE